MGRLRFPTIPDSGYPPLPGTPAKLRLMGDRRRRGRKLFQPGDPTLDGDWALIVTQGCTSKTKDRFSRHHSPIVVGVVNQRTGQLFVGRPKNKKHALAWKQAIGRARKRWALHRLLHHLARQRTACDLPTQRRAPS